MSREQINTMVEQVVVLGLDEATISFFVRAAIAELVLGQQLQGVGGR
jgi:hypothetical protein